MLINFHWSLHFEPVHPWTAVGLVSMLCSRPWLEKSNRDSLSRSGSDSAIRRRFVPADSPQRR